MKICKNILAVETSAALCVVDGFDEALVLAKLFGSSHPFKALSNRFFYFYDVDESVVLTQSDKAFQRFRLKVAEMDYDRGREVQGISFQKAFYVLRAT